MSRSRGWVNHALNIRLRLIRSLMSAARTNICPLTHTHTRTHTGMQTARVPKDMSIQYRKANSQIARKEMHSHIHRITAGGGGSDCQGAGRWVGTKQTTLTAGCPYRKDCWRKEVCFMCADMKHHWSSELQHSRADICLCCIHIRSSICPLQGSM